MRTHISQRVCVERRNFDRVRVNRVVGRRGNRTVTVVVDMGDGYEQRMRHAILLVHLRLEAISRSLSLSHHRREVVAAAARRRALHIGAP